MAGKGKEETDVFKLSVKVDIINKCNEDAVEKLQKAFQANIALLQQHLKIYQNLQSQDLNCVTKEKKHLRFEFGLRSAKALEDLKCCTENGKLAKALSDVLDKKSINLDIGLDSQLCFKCKLEKKQYLQGQLHFTEESSESSEEEAKGTADQKKQSNALQGAPGGRGPNEKNNFGEEISAKQKQPNTLQAAPTGTGQNKLQDVTSSTGQNKLQDVTSSTGRNKLQDAPTGSGPKEKKGFESVEVKEMSTKDKQKQASTPQGVPTPSGSRSKEKEDSGDFKTGEPAATLKKGRLPDPSQSVCTPVQAATVQEAKRSEIVKYFYIYLPFKSSEIQHVFLESDCKELNGTRLSLISGFRNLWEVVVVLNPTVLESQNFVQIIVEKSKGWNIFSRNNYFRWNIFSRYNYFRDDYVNAIDSSKIQRIFWMKASQDGFFCHAQHIIQHCHEDMNDSILQMKSLVQYVSPYLMKWEVTSTLKDLQRDNFLADNKKSLMFGVMVVCFKEHGSLMHVVNDDAIQVLFHALCQLKMTDVPDLDLLYLHNLSYFVMQRKYGKEFCLILWMSHMYPFLDEIEFLEEIKLFLQQSKAIGTSDDAKTAALAIGVCTVLKDRIKNGKSEKGPELLLSLLENLCLPVVIKVYSQSVDKETDFTDIKIKIIDVLISKICTQALQHFNEKKIGKLKYLWDQIKFETYAQLLTETFEKHILGLLSKTGELNVEFIALFEDEILFKQGPNQESLLQLIAKSPTRAVHQHMIALAKLTKYKDVIGTVCETWLETAITRYSRTSSSNQSLVSMYSYLCDAISLQQGTNDEKFVQRLENRLCTMKTTPLKPIELLKIAHQIFSTSKATQLVQDIFQRHFMRLMRDQHSSKDLVEILISICGKDIRINDKFVNSILLHISSRLSFCLSLFHLCISGIPYCF